MAVPKRTEALDGRWALTVPTITLFPSTNSMLSRSLWTSCRRSPEVMEDNTRTPFFASACIDSKTMGENPVASKIKSNGPNLFVASGTGISRVLT